MMNKIPFQEEQAGSWVTVDSGVQRMVMGYTEELMMVKVKFERSAVGVQHSHIHIQTSYVAKGCFEVTIDGVTSILREGDSFFVEPNLMHGVICIEEGTLVDVFCPYRADFL